MLEVGPFCVVSLVSLQNRCFEQLATICVRLSITRLLVFSGSNALSCSNFINYTKHQPVQAVFSFFFIIISQKHIENHRTITFNEKFDPLHLFQLKNLLNSGLLLGRV